MKFSTRYLLWLLAPAPLIALPVCLAFLSQVFPIHTAREWLALVAFFVGVAAVGELIFLARLYPALVRLDADAPGDDDVSAVLERTVEGSLIGWSAGVTVVAILGPLFFLPIPLGAAYFLVAALAAAVPSFFWRYAAGKRLLEPIAGQHGLRYTGRKNPIPRKIGIVFISVFLVSALALVLLVSSRVSTRLERLALEGAGSSFSTAWSVAAEQEDLDFEQLTGYIDPAYELYRIAPDGAVTGTKTASPFDERDVEFILESDGGDSVELISDNVFHFQQLPDGSFLVLRVPWDAYAAIPFQIGFYTLVITALTLAVFALAIFFLSRDIRRPLDRLAHASTAMAAGDFRVDPGLFADDELGALGEQFAETRANLERLITRVGTGGRAVTDGVRGVTGGSTELARRSREQAEITENSSLALGSARERAESVLQAAEAVASQTQDASSRALELQASAEEVARSMDTLFQSVEKTSSSTTEMDAAAREMSGRTSFLADVGNEVLSFVAEMDTTIEELRRRAQTTSELSRRVREDAEAGGAAVGDTVEGIRQAQESSRRTAEVLDDLQGRIGQISQILNVIEEVTDRTNLLSLNAAIIAAQAGDQGAGFSVVADEIRELADRTRGSTKEIAGIIKAIQSGSREAVRAMQSGLSTVDQNVAVAQNAAGSLEKILARANESSDMADRISGALSEQTSATRHLHELTSRMLDHITEIDRSTQEQARATRLLAQEADRVREIALQVKNSTEEQSVAGRGITAAMERVAADVGRTRDLLDAQLTDMAKIAEASQTMLMISQRNEVLARDFQASMQGLADSGRHFEDEVSSFRLT
ncbi:MAG: methyl-accepting chemotaxis protein [Thermoanaerobaculia bacterium]